jgi:AcrR family transcriptional regulator
MARWEPDAQGRLMVAAIELFEERGFEQTTVAEIAERAGLTKRTFFRHYADKREVLFSGQDTFRDTCVGAVRDAPADERPLDAIARGLRATGHVFEPRRPFSRRRQHIIDAHTELRERELVKLDTVAQAIAQELREKGVEEPRASIAAQTGMAAFKVAFERWVADTGDERTLTEHVDEALSVDLTR